MNKQIAKEVDRLARHANGLLNEATQIVKDNCTQAEFEQFRTLTGRIMGAIVIDILQPLYAEHPDIVPDELK